MKKNMALIAVLAMILFTTPAIAGNTYDPGVNKRQRVQRHRIVDGVKSGELNRREAFRLSKEQAHIAGKERAFKSDGTLTKRERINLQRSLDRSGRHIFREKHDRQHRR
ncbi:MAG TPA: hypothetical protein ENG95_02880 [Nitrospirae bacterium]|nr:hypothetical protein BMS3Abin10_02281 [bacterium BMS3Abin10]GBE38533.1 hypothetical protein BMS3Bbin08_01140 [bacterium BMS3Bbin08]HDH50161.1 hypothetical protein [Nitrospirota bacterium]HDK17154.1 hypothetical protein [Nitrospirota bacterium]HDO25577.1 hypothetical protein [Nitrospirota bacterium]